MHTTNYANTLIRVAPDCTARARVPDRLGTVGALQYRLLSEAPYALTSDALMVEVRALRTDPAADRAAVRAELFARPQACLRASPLVKTLGWALHHDARGRVALVDPGSERHAALEADPDVVKVNGMRSSRA